MKTLMSQKIPRSSSPSSQRFGRVKGYFKRIVCEGILVATLLSPFACSRHITGIQTFDAAVSDANVELADRKEDINVTSLDAMTDAKKLDALRSDALPHDAPYDGGVQRDAHLRRDGSVADVDKPVSPDANPDVHTLIDASSVDTLAQDATLNDAQSSDASPTDTSITRLLFVSSVMYGSMSWNKLFLWENDAITQLTSGSGHDRHPTWCVLSDGSVYIVFALLTDDGRRQLLRLNFFDLDAPPVQLTESFALFNPQCAPSGRIYYECTWNSICSILVDGTDLLTVLSTATEMDTSIDDPSPSSDETELVFRKRFNIFAPGADVRIYKVSLIRGVATDTGIELALGEGNESAPSFSPVAPLIAFQHSAPGTFAPNQIAIASSVDGSGLTTFVFTGTNFLPRFSRPNGEFILYGSDNSTWFTLSDGTVLPPGRFNIFMVSVLDGSITNITPQLQHAAEPEMYIFSE